MFAFMDAVEIPKLPENAKSFHTIEKAIFIEDVDDFVARPEYANDTEMALRSLSTLYRDYGDTALILESRYVDTQAKIEVQKNSLKLVRKLVEKREEFTTGFMLFDNVYINAVVPPVDKVIVMLGANVMVEYNLDEAENFIKENIKQKLKDLKMLEHDLDYIKDQLTTTESNISRVYNNGLDKTLREQEAKAAAQTTGERRNTNL